MPPATICAILYIDFRVTSPAPLGPQRGIERSNGEIFFGGDSVSHRRVWLVGVRNVREVGMLLVQKILEESIDMHRSHPALQSHTVLLYFLDALPFRSVWWFYPEFHDQLGPGLDLLGIELSDQLEQSIDIEDFVVTLWRLLEVGLEGGLVGIQGDLGITVQDERHISIRDGLRSDIL